MRSIRGSLRMFGVIQIIPVIAISLMWLVLDTRPLAEIVLVGQFGLVFPFVAFVVAFIDLFVVTHFVVKIQPVKQLDAAKVAFLQGTTWKELKELCDKVAPALSAKRELEQIALSMPNFEALPEFWRLMESQNFVQAVALLERQERVNKRREKQEAFKQRRQEASAARKSRKHEALFAEGRRLGLADAEIKTALSSGQCRELIASERHTQQQRERAVRLGAESLVSGQLAKRDVSAARVALDMFEALLAEARSLGVEAETRRLADGGCLEEVRTYLADMRKQARNTETIAAYQRRIEKLKSGNRATALDLLDQLRQAPFGSRQYRKLEHDLGVILG